MDIEASARERGVSDDDMLHALRQHWRGFEADDPDVTMFIGPSSNADPLGVGVVHDADGVAIIHAATVDVDTVAPIFDWMRSHGFRTTGYSREQYLECPDDLHEWRTEMQFPIEPIPDQHRSRPEAGAISTSTKSIS